MINRLFHKSLMIVLMALLSACASTSSSIKESVSLPKTIRMVENYHPEVAQFVPSFLEVVGQNGFSVGYTEDPDAATLRVDFDPNIFHTAIYVKLMQGNKVLLSSEASNSGWGTGIARASALDTLAENVKRNLDKELKVVNFKMMQDRFPSEEYCTQKLTTTDLQNIKDKVSMSLEPVNDFKLLLINEKANDAQKKSLLSWISIQQDCFDNSIRLKEAYGASRDWMNISKSTFLNTQISLAKLVNSQITFGEFQKERLNIFDQARNQLFDSEAKRLAVQRDKIIEGKSTTDSIQKNMIGSQSLMMQNQQLMLQQQQVIQQQIAPQSTFRPFSCNKIGNMVNCY
jgi:hypothetical protein